MIIYYTGSCSKNKPFVTTGKGFIFPLFLCFLRQCNAADGHVDLADGESGDRLDAGLDVFLHVLGKLKDVLAELGDNVAVDAQRARLGA